MSHNTIPEELIAIPKYPGYFWHPEEKNLYSLKITGTLTALSPQRPFRAKGFFFPAGFNLSKNGRRRRMPLEDLMKLKPTPYQVPYTNKKEID